MVRRKGRKVPAGKDATSFLPSSALNSPEPEIHFVPLTKNRGLKDFLESTEELPTSLEFKMDKTIPMLEDELKEIDELLGTCSLALFEGEKGRIFC